MQALVSIIILSASLILIPEWDSRYEMMKIYLQILLMRKHSLEENMTQYIEDFVHEDDRDMLRRDFFQRTAHKGAGRKEDVLRELPYFERG